MFGSNGQWVRDRVWLAKDEVLGWRTDFVSLMSFQRHSCGPGIPDVAEGAVVVEKTEALAVAHPRVLLVEDEADIRELIRYSLAQAGLEVVEAGDGAEALEKLSAFAPDLVVLDLMLPGMPGLELCQRLRARADTARLPIMVVSAKSSPSDKALGLAMGADDYITKPFSPRDLLTRAIALLPPH